MNGVARRLQFPITRQCAKQVMMVGAAVASQWSSEYLQTHAQASHADEVEDDLPVGFYL